MKNSLNKRRNLVIVAGFLVVLAGLLFMPLFKSQVVLFTTDDNVGDLVSRVASLPHSWYAWWMDNTLLGSSSFLAINLNTLMMIVLPGRLYVNLIHIVCLFMASFFVALFLSERRVKLGGILMAAIVVGWLGANFTLTYAGHLGKYAILGLAAVCLWGIGRMAVNRSMAWGVTVGGLMGVMFLEQQDVALFFAMLLGPYAILAIARHSGWNVRILTKLILPMVLVCGLVAFRSLWAGYATNIQGVAAVSEDNPQAKWEFCTQWSLPPDETIDFMAPGFTGWRTGEPEGPYWGRSGRSAGWEQTRQGFMNFRLESLYLGAIPVFLAVFAVVSALFGRRQWGNGKGDADEGIEWGERWAEIFFWGGAALLALLLSYGKYFPLYAVFYKMPVVNNIRNPMKFIQVFQLALGILAAYGLDLALTWRSRPRISNSPAPTPTWMRVFVWSALGFSGILGIWALGLAENRTAAVSQFASQGWGQYAEVIIGNKIRALWQATFMALCAGGALWWMLVKKVDGEIQQGVGVKGKAETVRRRAGQGGKAETRQKSNVYSLNSLVVWIIVLLVAGDAWLLSRHYIKTMPISALDENRVISILKTDMPEKRVALVSQDGFYNWWLTYLFPYHGINSVNITQMPRMPTDYKNFLAAVSRSPLRLWQLSAVGYVLAPAQVWTQIQRDPAWSNSFDLVYSYNVAPVDPAGIGAGFNVYPATAQFPGQHVVLRLSKPAPRFTLIGKHRVTEDEEALKLLGSSMWQPFEEVLVSNAETLRLSAGQDGKEGSFDSTRGRSADRVEWGALTNAGIVGICKLMNYRAGRMEIDIQAQQPAILRIAEKYDKDWEAMIDGVPAVIHRIDYIFQGILVPTGAHHVVVKYAPPMLGLYVQFAGFTLCFGAAVWLVVGAVRRRIK